MLGLYNFERFDGFKSCDFDAFDEHKWASNRFNLERMRARAVMEALGKDLSKSLSGELNDLVFRTTPHNPDHFNHRCVSNLWLFLDRPEHDKAEMEPLIDRDTSLRTQVLETTPVQRFALVGVSLDRQGSEVFFRLHSDAIMDRRNALARLGDPVESQQAAALFGALAAGASATLSDQAVELPADSGSVEGLRRRLEEYCGWFSVGYRFARDDEALSTGAYVERVGPLMRPLIALWRFCAWSRANDRLKLAKAIKEEKRTKARKLTGFETGDPVTVISGLLAGKQGTVQGVDSKGRVKVLIGRVSVDMDSKLLRK